MFKKLFPPIKDNILFYLFLLLLVFIPLYPKFPFANIPGTYVAIRLEDLFLVFVVGLTLLVNYRKLKILLSKSITQSILLFFFIGFLVVLSGIFITFTVVPHISILHWIRRIEYISLFFVAITVIKNRQQVELFLFTMTLVTAAVIFYGLGQIYLDFGVISTTNREFSKGLIVQLTEGARLNSTFAGHYDLAIFLSYILVFLGVFAVYYKKIYQKLFLLIFAGISFFVLGLTAARISFASTLLGVTMTFWLLGKRLLIILLIIVSIITVVTIPNLRDRFIATINVNILQQGGVRYSPSSLEQQQGGTLQEDLDIMKGISSISSKEQSSSRSADLPVDVAPGEPTNYTELEVSRSLDIRLEVEWPRAIASFTKNPMLGTGYSSLTLATDNDYLRALGETGLLGIFALGMIFFIITKRLLLSLSQTRSFENTFIIGCLGMLVSVAVTATFFDILEASKVASLLWATLGIGWAVTEMKKNE